MDFFEALRERINKACGVSVIAQDWGGEATRATIDATIEALKEMMVGEPITGSIRHGSISYTTKPLNTTVLQTEEGSLRIARDHHGTDGEEVAVMVFRKP